MAEIDGYCDQCGGPLPDANNCYGWDRDDSVFCSESCAESREDLWIEEVAEDGGVPRYGL